MVELACPQCGEQELHHSRPRSFAERVRRRLTTTVPVRCHACGWRGWRPPLVHATPTETRDVHGELTEDELERLDPGKR